jgi:AraC family transcriptional regulator of adaptative response/methylated-DNA-[protein]-cysteine methyltransferase
VSRTRQVDNPDALVELLAERVAIARRSRFIIEPLDHEKRGCSGTPPIFERHTSAAREVGEMHRRPAFDLRKYFRIRRRRQPARPQHGDAIAAVHLDFGSVAKAGAEWCCGSDETACRKQSHAAYQRGPVDRQTASDPIAEGMTNEVRRTAIQSFKDPSHIGGQVVHSYAVERAAALSSTAHVDTDGLQPSGSERARQIVKITAAAAGIREQHNRSARTVEGAFERRAADFDVSVLLQSHSPASRLTLDAQSVSWRADDRPERLRSEVVEPSHGCWPKPDSIPKRESGREAAATMIVRMSLDFAECDRARLARNAAYDGRFYTGVHTTGIYCRPVCPVGPARSANVSFFPSAAAAEAAGFRPCLRCRPETAPFSSAWIGSRATVERALRLIAEEGALDQEGATVERLAQRLGMGSRQLTRLFARHLRASPSKVARTARVQRAKRLLDQTSLPMTEIAMQAGFRSLRRFNSVFVEVYGRPPTEIRRTRGSAGKAEQKAKDLPFCSSSGRLQLLRRPVLTSENLH